MVLETQLYFESHVTIEPVFEYDDIECNNCGLCLIERDHAKSNCPGPTSDIDKVKQISREYGFKVADLLMQKRAEDSAERSRHDTFTTGRSKSYEDIHTRMVGLIKALQKAGFKVWRYKIEDTVLDSKMGDLLRLL